MLFLVEFNPNFLKFSLLEISSLLKLSKLSLSLTIISSCSFNIGLLFKNYNLSAKSDVTISIAPSLPKILEIYALVVGLTDFAKS
jgi:hypothetical protein